MRRIPGEAKWTSALEGMFPDIRTAIFWLPNCIIVSQSAGGGVTEMQPGMLLFPVTACDPVNV